MCHCSNVTCPISCDSVTGNFFFDKVVELVDEWSVIKEPTPSNYYDANRKITIQNQGFLSFSISYFFILLFTMAFLSFF